jgi:hypothetical protein
MLALAALFVPASVEAGAGVEFFAPQGSAKQIRQASARFGTPMVALGDARLASPFEVDCGEPGRGRWSDPQSWVFDFERDLPAGVACRFSLRAGVTDLAGRALSAPREFRFDSGGPAVRASNPYDGARGIDEQQVFVLALDGRADSDSIEAHARCAVSGIGETLGVEVLRGAERDAVLSQKRELGYAYYSILWKDGFESLARVTDERLAEAEERLALVRCRRPLPPETAVSLVWGAGIRSASGIATAHDQTLAFETRSAFSAVFSCPRVRAGADCLALGDWRLDFSAPIARELAERVRLVDASGAARRTEIGDAPRIERIGFPGPFPERARFAIELPAELRDDAGRALANASRFPLAVASDALPPLAKFSAEFGILESKAEPVLPVTLRRLEPELAVRIAGFTRAAPGSPSTDPAARAEIPAQSLQIADDDAEILRWLKQVSAATSRRGRSLQQNGEWVWVDETGSTSVFANAQPPSARFALPRSASGEGTQVVGIPLAGSGLHVVELASPLLGAELLGPGRTRYVATAALVTNLAVHSKWGREGSLVWVTALDSGEPVPNAEVRVSNYCSGDELWSGRTDADGIARIASSLGGQPHAEDWCGDGAAPPLFASARAGGELGFATSFWARGIRPYDFGFEIGSWEDPLQAHSVLDRPLFRAGESVSMLHVLRSRSAQGLEIPAELRRAELVVSHEASAQEYRQPLAFGARGLAESRFEIPRAAKLGRYALRVELEEGDARKFLPSGEFRVEEFRVPSLRAVVQPPAAPLVGAREVDVDLFVGYLSGGGAAGAPVKLRTLVRPKRVAFPTYSDYQFGGDDVREGTSEADLFDFDEFRRRQTGAPVQPPRVLELSLDAAGAARAHLADLPAVERAHEVVAELEYQDANGEILTASNRFGLYPSAVQLGIRREGWVASSEQVRFRVVALDLQGAPIAGLPIEVESFEKTTYSHRRRLVGGFYAYENRVTTKRLAARCRGRTDANGLLACELAPGISGRLALAARASDERGRVARATSELWVAGRGEWWFGGGASDRMDLLPEEPRYEPGESARFQVRMPFRRATALVTVEREGVLDARVVELRGNRPIVEVPLRAAFAPNVFVSVLAVRGRVGALATRAADVRRAIGIGSAPDGGAPTALVDLSKPAYRIGAAQLDVGWRAHRIEVEVLPNAEVYRTREVAKVRVRARRADGGALPTDAEVAIAAVDEGLLELAPNGSWDLLEGMMARRGIEVFTATAQMQVVGKRHYGRKAMPAGGGGGSQSARELFDTLLYWRARVPLGPSGEALVELPLNDSLSSFRIAAIASAGAALFGTGSASVRTSQELMLHAGLPPRVREGDRLPARVTLRNASQRAERARVGAELAVDGGAARALPEREVELAAGAAQEVAWDLEVPAGARELRWEFSARGAGGGADRMRATQQVSPAVPVRAVQATLAQLDAARSLPVAIPVGALPGRGGVDVALAASLVGSLDGVREYMREYRYVCLEQLVSQAVALRDAAAFERLAGELSAWMDSDGLLRFFPSEHLPGEDVLTAYVLAIAHEAGWEIPEPQRERLIRALSAFVEGRIQRDSPLPTADLALRKLAAIEALSRHGVAKAEWLEPLAGDPALWPASGLLNWIGILSRVESISQREAKRADAMRLLRARLDLQGTRLAFSAERDDALWWLLLSPDVSALRLLRTALDDPSWRAELPHLARGALARQRRGHWFPTTANAWGVLAFERFSRAFEAERVAGRSAVALGSERKSFDWSSEASGGALDFAWPPARASLSLAHAGSGAPWATITARAAIPRRDPDFSGFALRRSVTPIAQQRPGAWTRGDVARVSLEVDAQSDATWVVVEDPIPSGARIEGGGLGRSSQLLGAGEARDGDAWPAFEERRLDAFRAYYRYVPKGRLRVEYTLRYGSAGRFELPPTRAEAMYDDAMSGELPNAAVEVLELGSGGAEAAN